MVGEGEDDNIENDDDYDHTNWNSPGGLLDWLVHPLVAYSYGLVGERIFRSFFIQLRLSIPILILILIKVNVR